MRMIVLKKIVMCHQQQETMESRTRLLDINLLVVEQTEKLQLKDMFVANHHSSKHSSPRQLMIQLKMKCCEVWSLMKIITMTQLVPCIRQI